MDIGQISINKISKLSDYLQLDICGYNKDEVLDKYKKYNTTIPVILHGDWTKKGFSENNLASRYTEYINIINLLQVNNVNVLGLTIHPVSKKKMSMETMNNLLSIINKETDVDVFIENRSNKRLYLSDIDSIIKCSNFHLMTIDIPQLYISCNYNETLLIDTLNKINMTNVKEIHLGNIKRQEKHTYVGRKLNEAGAELDIKKIVKYIPKDKYFTLELLGGTKVFEDSCCYLREIYS